MPPSPCSTDEVRGVLYLVLSITWDCLSLQLQFKVIPLEPLMSDDSVAQPVAGGVPQCPQRDWPGGSPSRSGPDAAGVPRAPGVIERPCVTWGDTLWHRQRSGHRQSHFAWWGQTVHTAGAGVRCLVQESQVPLLGTDDPSSVPWRPPPAPLSRPPCSCGVLTLPRRLAELLGCMRTT